MTDKFDCDYCFNDTKEVYSVDEGHSFICEECLLENEE